jgi:hypothetical protein
MSKLPPCFLAPRASCRQAFADMLIRELLELGPDARDAVTTLSFLPLRRPQGEIAGEKEGPGLFDPADVRPTVQEPIAHSCLSLWSQRPPHYPTWMRLAALAQDHVNALTILEHSIRRASSPTFLRKLLEYLETSRPDGELGIMIR